jgi:tetratricopeptide (TPR) repeat protein
MAPKVSLCMIVKNEEEDLPACLASAADLVDEVVVVDTGSTDRTKEVAASRGARVSDFPWVDSFAAARNESLRQATGRWIFWLDADDRIDEDNRRRLRQLFAGLADDNAAYLMRCLCTSPGRSGLAVLDHVRLFRNRPDVRWKYRIHEQILPALEQLGHDIRRTDITIQHVGYQEQAEHAQKAERNLRLLQLEDAEHPNDPFVLFNLGVTCQELGRLPEAQAYYRRSLQGAHIGQSFVHKAFAMLVQATRQLGQPHEALAICRHARVSYPDDADLLSQEARLLYQLGDYWGTERCLLQLLEGPRQPDTSLAMSVDTGLRGYLTRHNLAVLYRDLQRLGEAEAQWQAVLAERPDFAAARLGLGELYLAQGRWPEVEQVSAQLQADPRTAVEAAVLRAQKHLAWGEYAAARQVLGEAIARAPQALGPRIVLSRVLWAEGLDPAATERALRDVLALDPNNSEARGNLMALGHRTS